MPLWVGVVAMIIWLTISAFVMYKVQARYREYERIAKALRDKKWKVPPK